MNYFELINKCLVELNYKQVNTFSELTKNDHKKLKNILNVINAEICAYDNWNFLLKQIDIILPKNKGEIENSVNGRIASLVIDNKQYAYHSDFEDFLRNKQPENTFSVFNEKLLLPIFEADKTVQIVYYTRDCAVSDTGESKKLMETGNDSTLIPAPFVEPLLVYGSCMRLKANAQHVKFNYWYSMYKDALANLRSKISVIAYETPSIKLFRY